MVEKVGLQLYSLRNVLDADNFAETLQNLDEYGYSGVEFYDFYGKDASEIREVLDSTDLKPISSHVAIEELRDNLEETLNYHENIGCDTIVVPYLASDYFEDSEAIKETVNELTELAEKLDERGFDLGYHNHFHEFFAINDLTAFEYFAQQIPKNVGIQPDVGHIYRGGKEPVEFLENLDNWFVSFHMKDVEDWENVDIDLGKGELTKEKAEELGDRLGDVRLGNGTLDLKKAVEIGKEKGVTWFIIEDESAPEPMEAAKQNLEYLASL